MTRLALLAASLTALSLASPTFTDSSLQKRNTEGLHLVNCVKSNGQQTSAMWYYVNDGNTSPSDVAVISTGQWAKWEGQQVSGHFESGVTFTSFIQNNAQSQATYSKVGTGNNGSPWNCYKDDQHVIANSGCKSIYYCLKA